MPNVTASMTARITQTRLAVVSNVIQIFTLSKTAESGSNLFSVIRIDYRRAVWAARWAVRWAVCWKEPQALTALFISFFFESSSCHLWSFCFYLHLSLRVWLCCCFFPLFFDQPICQRTLLGFQRVVVAFTAKASVMMASSQVNLIFWFLFLFSDHLFQSHLVFCTQPSDSPSFSLNILLNVRLWHQAL